MLFTVFYSFGIILLAPFFTGKRNLCKCMKKDNKFELTSLNQAEIHLNNK